MIHVWQGGLRRTVIARNTFQPFEIHLIKWCTGKGLCDSILDCIREELWNVIELHSMKQNMIRSHYIGSRW